MVNKAKVQPSLTQLTGQWERGDVRQCRSQQGFIILFISQSVYDHASTSLPPSLHHWTSNTTLLIPNFSSVCHILLGFSSLSVALFLFLSPYFFLLMTIFFSVTCTTTYFSIILLYFVLFCFLFCVGLSSLLWCHMLKWWPYLFPRYHNYQGANDFKSYISATYLYSHISNVHFQ